MGQPGGALLYGALGATLWGARPGLVSVLGDDYPAHVLDQLQQRGVDLAGVFPLGRPGVRTWLLYEGTRPAPDSSAGVSDTRGGFARARTRPCGMERRPSISSRADAIRRAARTTDGLASVAAAASRTQFHSSRSTLTGRSPRRHSTSGGKPWRTPTRFFPARMNSCSKGWRRILIGRFRASSTDDSGSLSSSAAQKVESCTTRMKSVFTPGKLAHPPSWITPARGMLSPSGWSWRASKGFRSTPACNARSSRQASPSKAGDPRRC